MPNGFWYASGPYETGAGKPASAFSKGDLLVLDSTSSLSRMPVKLDLDWVGIALADSDDSIADQVPYLIPEDSTNLWGSLAEALTSEVTPGVESSISFDTDNNRYFLDKSATSVRARVLRGTAGPLAIDQSGQSRVICRLIRDGGEAEF